jgi:hypothetical protein
MSRFRIAQPDPDAMPLLQVGDSVGTPEGQGIVVNIALQIADYQGDVQIDPPAILIQLESGQTQQFCLCELDFGSEEINETVGKEFSRLWPPIDMDVPDAAVVLAARKE